MIRAEKAYSLISAADHQMITGDSFEIQNNAVYNIGNNVDIEYTGMDFSKGVSSVIITGRAKNHPDHIHIRFFKDGEIIKPTPPRCFCRSPATYTKPQHGRATSTSRWLA